MPVADRIALAVTIGQAPIRQQATTVAVKCRRCIAQPHSGRESGLPDSRALRGEWAIVEPFAADREASALIGSVVRNVCILVAVIFVAALILRDLGVLSLPGRDASSGDRQQSASSHLAITGSNALVIRADSRGHFLVDASIGTKDVRFLVDTGASSVALSRQDAERLGFYVHQLDYSGRAQTANGMARFAPVTIEEIRIGDIVVRDVAAAVMDTPMKGSLLGMTFLRRLAGFEVRDDRLILRW